MLGDTKRTQILYTKTNLFLHSFYTPSLPIFHSYLSFLLYDIIRQKEIPSHEFLRQNGIPNHFYLCPATLIRINALWSAYSARFKSRFCDFAAIRSSARSFAASARLMSISSGHSASSASSVTFSPRISANPAWTAATFCSSPLCMITTPGSRTVVSGI